MLASLSALAHADPDDGDVPAASRARARARPKRRARRSARSDACTGACTTRFDRLQHVYERALATALGKRRAFLLGFGAFAAGSLVLVPFVGRDFFPYVDAGQLRIHFRAPTGTRLEETEHYAQRVEDRIRTVIPADEIAVILDNLGVPNGINLALTDSATLSAAEGEILVSLKPGHGPTPDYLKQLRAVLAARVPRGQLLRAAGEHGQRRS